MKRCAICKHRPATGQSNACGPCRLRIARQRRAKERAAAGLCADCGKCKPRPGCVACARCAHKRAAPKTELMRDRRARGVCVKCEAPVPFKDGKPMRYCVEHAKLHADYQRRLWRRRHLAQALAELEP